MVQKAESVNRAMDAVVSLKDPIMIHEAIRHSLLAGGKTVQLIHCHFVCELVDGSESMAVTDGLDVADKESWFYHLSVIIMGEEPRMAPRWSMLYSL